MEDLTCSAGDSCSGCGFELMEISREELQKSIKALRPAFQSIPQKVLEKKLPYTPVCPRCDAYALGLEMQTGFLIKNSQGERLTIHDMDEESLFGNG